MSNEDSLDELEHLLTQKIGIRIPPSARDRFAAMLHERATLHGLSTLEEYRAYLLGDGASEEWEEFARSFASRETFFFRDHGQFDLLRLRLLPDLIAQRRDTKTLRLWSAGCASGEEAYSLAMLVDMLLPEHGDWNILILGTDIDSIGLAKARQGHYRQWSFRMTPAAMQQRYFHPEEREWALDDRIRRMVTFRVVNLIDEAFPDSRWELHDMDLILCRNVFIYFAPSAISAVATKLAATLAEGGYLMTAHTELIGQQAPGLESRLFAEGVVYQRHSHPPAHAAVQPSSASAAVKIAPAATIPGVKAPGRKVHIPRTPEPPQTQAQALPLDAAARTHADRGEYELAERMCREALAAHPLAAPPYFLLAQLAQLKGDFEEAKAYLNKALYLDHGHVAAHLELAALHERGGDRIRAQALRHAALGIVRTMPKEERIEQYETTAGELAQWLAQEEALANNGGGNERDTQREQ